MYSDRPRLKVSCKPLKVEVYAGVWGKYIKPILELASVVILAVSAIFTFSQYQKASETVSDANTALTNSMEALRVAMETEREIMATKSLVAYLSEKEREHLSVMDTNRVKVMVEGGNSNYLAIMTLKGTPIVSTLDVDIPGVAGRRDAIGGHHKNMFVMRFADNGFAKFMEYGAEVSYTPSPVQGDRVTNVVTFDGFYVMLSSTGVPAMVAVTNMGLFAPWSGQPTSP